MKACSSRDDMDLLPVGCEDSDKVFERASESNSDDKADVHCRGLEYVCEGASVFDDFEEAYLIRFDTDFI